MGPKYISTEESKKKSASCIFEETIKFVKDFYTCSDIVYTMPGMKDELTIWEKGVKRHEQKYYLTMFLQEAYNIYSNLPITERVKFSKFCELCPKNVLLLNLVNTRMRFRVPYGVVKV